MSNAATNVAAALTSAQDRKATRTSKPQAGKNLPGARRSTQTAQAPRQVITFETAQRLCPTEGQINRIVQVYGLDAVDYHAIREASEQAIGTVARAMTSYMNETAMRMHLQRIVGAHIGSAFGAGQFYDTKAEQARNLTSAIANEDRDEDRMGVDGGANRAARARDFAATAAVQAYAVLAAAEGAKDAYAEIVGEDWKPYVGQQQGGQTVDGRAAAAQLAAFDRE